MHVQVVVVVVVVVIVVAGIHPLLVYLNFRLALVLLSLSTLSLSYVFLVSDVTTAIATAARSAYTQFLNSLGPATLRMRNLSH